MIINYCYYYPPTPHGCRPCGNNQGRLDPWSLDAISPWTTWSQVVKGRTDHWSQLVKGSNPLPPGDPIWALKVPLWFPYGPLMVPLWLPYGPLMVALWLPYAPLSPPLRPPLGCANVARPRDDFHGFSLVFNGFHNFSMIFIDFH